MSAETVITRRISLAPDVDLSQLLGRNDDHLKTLESELDVRIVARGHEVTVKGDERQVKTAERAIVELAELVRAGTPVRTTEVRAALRMLADDGDADVKGVFSESIAVPSRKRWIAPKTLGQKRYVDAIKQSTITFAIGPAGTGKTYLAVASAVKALQEKEVSRIILTRPAVEAGERLGFLPGTLYEKIDPYLKPLYDALYEMIGADAFQRLMERGTVEVAPLAFMRGRSLNDSFIILDEAQNTSPEQMKMFLTGLGFGSKAVVNGDVTQVDLPPGQRSGLMVVEEILQDIEGIEFIHLGARDVVRHKIVQDIVEAYRVYGEQRAARADG